MAKYDDETIVVKDKLYIPTVSVNTARVEKLYTHMMYEESACRRCPNRPDRHNFECDQCEAFKGAVQTYSTEYKNGIEYVGLPLGDKKEFERRVGFDLEEFDIIDYRVKTPFDYKVKMVNFELRDYQEKASKTWWKTKYGLIVAPPRSGKTPLALNLLVKLGKRAILIANQHEFLQQFIEHVEEYTNLPQLEKKYKKKLYGFPKKLEDYDTLQIAVCTYQQFMETTRGKERYKKAIKNFGTLAVDEAHTSASNEFARVLNRWPARYKLGLTGTPYRKDGRHKILFEVLGPVSALVERNQMTPKVTVHVCDYVKSRSAYKGKAGFTYACKFLANHKKRMDEILEFVLSDLAKGHSIVIPCHFKDHVFELTKRINDLAGDNVAESFVGGGAKRNKELRAATIERARSGKTRVVVGIRSLLRLGLNVPRWSCLYYVMPMNNEWNWKQESSRILTPMDPEEGEKRRPLIRMFVDPGIQLSLSCFANTYRHSMKFKHEPTDTARKRASEMFSLMGGSRSGDEEFGIEIDYEADDNYKKEPKSKSRKGAGGLFNR